jgi:methionyl-tRNA formyltransferase
MRVYLCGQKAFGAAAFEAIRHAGHEIVGVSAPMWSERESDRPDRLRACADMSGVPFLPAGMLCADLLPGGTDLIIAAHSHDFIGRETRLRAPIGAIGYHPSLLPRHRGRDAVRWAIRLRDPIAGGTVYWLSNNVDAGDIAAQDWCWVRPDDTADSLWRRELFPMGLRLLSAVLDDLSAGVRVAIPQDEDLATWEPSWSRPPLRRPDLLMLGDGRSAPGLRTVRETLADRSRRSC